MPPGEVHRDKQKSLQRSAEDAQNDYQQQSNEIAQRICRRCAVIDKFAKANGYGCCWTRPTLGARSASLATAGVDLTKIVVDAYNAQSASLLHRPSPPVLRRATSRPTTPAMASSRDHSALSSWIQRKAAHQRRLFGVAAGSRGPFEHTYASSFFSPRCGLLHVYEMYVLLLSVAESAAKPNLDHRNSSDLWKTLWKIRPPRLQAYSFSHLPDLPISCYTIEA